MHSTLRLRRCWLIPATFILLIATAVPAEESGQAGDKEADQRFAATKERVGRVTAAIGEQPEGPVLSRVAHPILRFSDPVRRHPDGALWLWTDQGAPAVILCTFIAENSESQWMYELTSLTDRALVIGETPKWSWRPRGQQREWLQLPGEAPSGAAARLQQFRTLAREFEASETWRGETTPLRLLPTPLYRYGSEEDTVVDGVLFTLAHGTNPEILIQIEARRSDEGNLRWFAAFAPLSAAELQVKRGAETVWTYRRPPRFDPHGGYISITMTP